MEPFPSEPYPCRITFAVAVTNTVNAFDVSSASTAETRRKLIAAAKHTFAVGMPPTTFFAIRPFKLPAMLACSGPRPATC